MPINTKSKNLHQIAEKLRKLSKEELETVELLLNGEARRTIQQSVNQAKKGRVKEL